MVFEAGPTIRQGPRRGGVEASQGRRGPLGWLAHPVRPPWPPWAAMAQPHRRSGGRPPGSTGRKRTGGRRATLARAARRAVTLD